MGKNILDKLKRFESAEPIIVVLCLLGSLTWAGYTFFGHAFDQAPYRATLVTSDSSHIVFTHRQSVGDFLKEAGIEPGKNDFVEPSIQTILTRGMIVTYRKAVPIILADSGQPDREIQCSGTTICDLLEQNGIEKGPLDRIEPRPSTPLKAGMTVKITRVEALDITEKKDISPAEVSVPDSTLHRGQTQEIDPGSPGVVEETTRVFYRNGQETERVNVASHVLVEPTDRVVHFGTEPGYPLISRGGLLRGTFTMVATAYDPGPGSCGASADGLTATGAVATRGVCAVDPRVIPLGTRLWIEGYGYALACDTGGAIKGNRIDVCFDTRHEALKWGRRSVEVRVVE
jgi:3D (Asp-Asp-Asp) domain-containing protein